MAAHLISGSYRSVDHLLSVSAPRHRVLFFREDFSVTVYGFIVLEGSILKDYGDWALDDFAVNDVGPKLVQVEEVVHGIMPGVPLGRVLLRLLKLLVDELVFVVVVRVVYRRVRHSRLNRRVPQVHLVLL